MSFLTKHIIKPIGKAVDKIGFDAAGNAIVNAASKGNLKGLTELAKFAVPIAMSAGALPGVSAALGKTGSALLSGGGKFSTNPLINFAANSALQSVNPLAGPTLQAGQTVGGLAKNLMEFGEKNRLNEKIEALDQGTQFNDFQSLDPQLVPAPKTGISALGSLGGALDKIGLDDLGVALQQGVFDETFSNPAQFLDKGLGIDPNDPLGGVKKAVSGGGGGIDPSFLLAALPSLLKAIDGGGGGSAQVVQTPPVATTGRTLRVNRMLPSAANARRVQPALATAGQRGYL